MPRILSALAALLGLSGPAMAYQTQNDLQVVATGNGAFMVQAAPGMGATRSWCAAGEYAMRRMNVSTTTLIWRLSEPPRKAGEGVMFSLSSEGAASRSGLLQLGHDTAGMSAGAARALCGLDKIG